MLLLLPGKKKPLGRDLQVFAMYKLQQAEVKVKGEASTIFAVQFRFLKDIATSQ